MADNNQYLHLVIGGQAYLLPGTLRYTIEQRENLADHPGGDGAVVAWRTVRNGRWPVYSVNARLRLAHAPADWQRAVFVEGPVATVGVVVDDAHLLSRRELQITSFTPLGPPATRAGHLFKGVWVREGRPMLVLDPLAFAAFLHALGS